MVVVGEVVDEPSRKDEDDNEDKDACRFTYPTEIPGGRIIYDLVPSYRWLSASDECQWGGVACGKTVTDEIDIDIDINDRDPTANATSASTTTTTKSRLAVTSIVLANQYLKGSIVTELTALPQLEMLDLSHNDLKGTLNDEFRSLQTLRLQYNALSGNIPSNFFDNESVMRELNVGSNDMTGTIPSDVGLASQMAGLYVFENQFTGRIPVLGNMPLVTFQGQGNSFNGILPFDYDYGGTWPDTMRSWWAYDNKLTGSLSENLGFLSNLEDLRVQDNQLTGFPNRFKNCNVCFGWRYNPTR